MSSQALLSLDITTFSSHLMSVSLTQKTVEEGKYGAFLVKVTF